MSQFTFGQPVENIAASEDNPTKRGIFIRYRNSHGSRMTEYATEGGCHTTPADNLRATPTAMAQSNGDTGRNGMDQWQDAENERLRLPPAPDSIAALRAQLEAARKALEECAKPWASPPGIVFDCFTAVGEEFQRRLDISAAALAALEGSRS